LLANEAQFASKLAPTKIYEVSSLGNAGGRLSSGQMIAAAAIAIRPSTAMMVTDGKL